MPAIADRKEGNGCTESVTRESERSLLLPAILTPSTMGISGRMHGRRIVSRPATKSVRKSVIA
ncbi:MAG: hypothetical protein AAB853_00625 [Patescibacteria group bacterium]